MKLEQQVCSLELAKRLKELVVKQESAFYWWQEKVPSNPNRHEYKWPQSDLPILILLGRRSSLSGYKERTFLEVSAFTVAELGEMLPDNCASYRTACRDFGDFVCEEDVVNVPIIHPLASERADTEANARAKMLIHLIEKGIVKPHA